MAPNDTPASAPTVGLKEAARIATVSLSTLRRRRDDLEAYGAHIDPESGAWSIPIPALVALGWLPSVTPAEGAAKPSTEPSMPPDETEALRQQIRDLQNSLQREQHRAELAEAISDERGRALDAERAALRMLTQGAAPAAPAAVPDQQTPAAEPPRRRWWQRS